jgi:hypothetical protein
MARRFPLPRAIAILVCGSCVTTGVLASGPAASAQNVKAQIASAQHELRALNNQAEAASERYNAARIKLAATEQTARGAQSRLSAAQA